MCLRLGLRKKYEEKNIICILCVIGEILQTFIFSYAAGWAGWLLAAGGHGEHGDEQAGESQGRPAGPELQRGIRRHLPLQVSPPIINPIIPTRVGNFSPAMVLGIDSRNRVWILELSSQAT